MRPIVLLSRNAAIRVRTSVTGAIVTRVVRGLPTEVALGAADGMPKPCVVNADVIVTFDKSLLGRRICALGPAKLEALARAVRFALALD
jgi:mRNA interferase MazF